MNAELKEKWLKALRSGEYKKGQGRLRRGDNYCCLGVLCDIVDSSKWENDKYDKYNANIPSDLNDKIDLLPSEEFHLIDLNDISNCSFLEIADYIEKNL